MRVSIIGSGVVGKATGLSLLVNGHDVLFYDINGAFRKGLPSNCESTKSWEKAFNHGEVLIICVPTPSGPGGMCNLTIFEEIMETFGNSQQSVYMAKTLVQKSTCPPGTAARAISRLMTSYDLPRESFGYMVCPEFLNAGSPLQDAIAPRKVIIGVNPNEDEAHNAAIKLFSWIPPHQRHFMSYAEAEFAKYVNNLFHALLISMWNELLLVGQRFTTTKGLPEIDLDKIAKLTALEPGLESIYRVFGKAWGGACLPKDTRAFRAFAGRLGMSTPITNALISVNETMKAEHGERTEHWHELHR